MMVAGTGNKKKEEEEDKKGKLESGSQYVGQPLLATTIRICSSRKDLQQRF